MRKLSIAIVAVALSSVSAQAMCFGSSAFSTCSDSSGNTYTVQRFGNTTITNGRNSQTGSSWSQNSQTFGNTTFHTGRAANGQNWNMQQQHIGNMDLYTGRDSRGHYFSHTCTQFGCN
jgi:hypothetical protein